MIQVTGAEIAHLLGVPAGPSAAALVSGVSSPDAAHGESLVFATDQAALVAAEQSAAGLILAPQSTLASARVLPVADPRLAFAQVYARWFDMRGQAGIDPSAWIEAGAQFGEGCEVGPGAVIRRGAVLGSRCILGPRAVVLGCVRLGDRVKVQAGAVLGSDGFGFARDRTGYVGFPQIGTLWIGDDVEIGANCTIDRGALGETRIGRGTKIDNLCHIAHNCILGEDVILAAQVGMAGSTVIEDGVVLGGQVGLGERVTIGRGVVLGGQGGVLPGKRLDGEGQVFWGTPARPVREYLRDLAAAKGAGRRRGKG